MLFFPHDLWIHVTFWYTCSCDERVWGSTRLPSHLSEAKSKTIMALSGPFQDRSESASRAVSQNRFNLALSPWSTQNCNPNVSSEKEKNAEIAFVWAVEQKSGERIYLKEYFHFFFPWRAFNGHQWHPGTWWLFIHAPWSVLIPTALITTTYLDLFIQKEGRIKTETFEDPSAELTEMAQKRRSQLEGLFGSGYHHLGQELKLSPSCFKIDLFPVRIE